MDLSRIEAVLQLLQRQSHVAEVQVEGRGWELQARKGPYGIPAVPAEPAPYTSEPPAPDRVHVVSDRVGFFRMQDGVLSPGDYVPAGAVVGEIDSMGVRSPVTVSEGGFVVEERVEDGEPVEFGQVLFVLSPELVHEESR